MGQESTQGGLIGLAKVLIENLESPYVWAPLILCVVLLAVFVPTNNNVVLYVALSCGTLALVAEWMGRWQNRRIPRAHFETKNLQGEVQEYIERVESLIEDLRQKGKGDAADTVVSRALTAIYGEFARLADEYDQVRAARQSGSSRTKALDELVSVVRRTSRSAALQVLRPATFLASGKAGSRVVGMGILEQFVDTGCFEQVLEIVTNSPSAFEQYHALVVLSGMADELEPGQIAGLEETLRDQMSGGEGKWIEEGTARWVVAAEILKKLRS